jgi:hypothetical protein
MKIDDRVMHRDTRAEGYIAIEMTAVDDEDDFGEINHSEPSFVSVVWDGNRSPDHVSRAKLIPIAGYRIRSTSDDLPTIFPTRQAAEAHRAGTLADPQGQQYTIYPVNEQGNAL